MDKIHLDHETACDLDLPSVGLDAYTAHPSMRVLMTAYRINGGKLQHWEAHKRKLPAEFKDAIEDPEVEKWGFGAQFERVVCKRALRLRTPIKGWRCGMVGAYMRSFHGGLEDVGQQVGLPMELQKLKDGKRLIRKFCMPQRITRNQPHEWRNWITDPEEWELFCEYNKQDVVTEESIDYRLSFFPVPDWRWDDYELDQRINDRGIPADMEFIDGVIWMSAKRKQELTESMGNITQLDNPNSVSQLLPWLKDHGYPFDNLRKNSVQKALALKTGDRQSLTVLRMRQWASVTSVQKAETAKRMIGEGGRIRYLFQFCGAGRTNRWAGRGVQPQNMKVTPKVLDAEHDPTKLSFVTDMIRTGDYQSLDLVMKEPMMALSGCMRSMFRTPENEKFVVCDSKSIESAVLGWVTNCQRLLQVFRDGKDPYRDFGTEFYQKPYEEITSAERTLCKPPCLGCGYRLGPGIILPDGNKTGLLAYADNMGIPLTPEHAKHAVEVFRAMYSEVPDTWKAYEIACEYVLRTKQPKEVGCLTFHWQKPFMLIRLPSGRDIFYYKPKIEPRRVYTGRLKKVRKRSEGMFVDGAPEGQWITVEEEESYIKNSFTYMGKNQKTTQWTRLDGHGGVITENVVQAFAYDVLMVKLRRMEEEGFHIVMHAHDEGGAVVRQGENRLTADFLQEIFVEPIDWAPGLPLGASKWEGQFYRK